MVGGGKLESFLGNGIEEDPLVTPRLSIEREEEISPASSDSISINTRTAFPFIQRRPLHRQIFYKFLKDSGWWLKKCDYSLFCSSSYVAEIVEKVENCCAQNVGLCIELWWIWLNLAAFAKSNSTCSRDNGARLNGKSWNLIPLLHTFALSPKQTRFTHIRN